MHNNNTHRNFMVYTFPEQCRVFHNMTLNILLKREAGYRLSKPATLTPTGASDESHHTSALQATNNLAILQKDHIS